MKKVIFENIYNKERFTLAGKQEKKFIDGVEYIKLVREGTQRELLVRRDFLKKVNT
jgi:hypothetical protein